MDSTASSTRPHSRRQDAAAPASVDASYRMAAVWAESEADVREAQRLRWRVFAEEMGARLQVPEGTPPGHDADRFDAYCDHVLVRVASPFDPCGKVVGTYRVLTPDAARRAGGFYSETEFDCSRLAPMRYRMAELGRSCIDPAWRKGGTLLTLWAALGEFMVSRGLDVAFGCASVAMSDGGRAAANLWRQLERTCLAPPERRVRPWRPLPLDAFAEAALADTPALIKGYLGCGAEFLGPPALDEDFNTADLPMLMTLAGLPQRHRRHFLER